jgi:hypothetical protein
VSSKFQLLAILISSGFLVLMIELLRRRRLQEREALVWLVASVALLAMSIWNGLLDAISRALGIKSDQNALFVMAGIFALALLLHLSLTVARLSARVEIMARRIAHMDHDLAAARDARDAGGRVTERADRSDAAPRRAA